MMRFRGKLLKSKRKNPAKTFFWVSGFSFSRATVISDVPYDPNLPFLFFGEETLMTLRLFTNGYDFFCPGEIFCYHLWERKHRPFFKVKKKKGGKIF